MSIIRISCCLLLISALVSCDSEELTQLTTELPSPVADGEILLSTNQVGADGTGTSYDTLFNISAQYEGTTFTNVTFAKGVRIFNTRTVKFVNCTFLNPGGHGVRFREELDTDDTDGVEFINCRFTDSQYDNVLIDRDDTLGNRVLHKNILFEGCAFEEWGTVSRVAERTFYHAIYAKAPNITIERCEFNSTVPEAGHALSLRSSARVTNNVFRHSEPGRPAISYTPKNLSGTPDKGWDDIRIQNNLIYSGQQNVPVGLIFLQTQDNEQINPNNIISTIVVRFNTIALLPGQESEGVNVSAIRVNEAVRNSNVVVYGNLLVDGRDTPSVSDLIAEKDQVDYLSNNVESTDLNEHFVDWQNGDFRLKAGSSAIGAVNDESSYIVPVDLVGNARAQGNADAGAYMFASETSTNAITVRAKGDCGSEIMELHVDGSKVAEWAVSTTMANYTYSGFSGGDVSVHFVNDLVEGDSCQDRNLEVDYIDVCGTPYQTEEVATKPAGCCPWNKSKLFENGSFDFGSLGCSS